METDMLVQLSHIGRSLPKGRIDKEGQKALMAHYNNLGTAAAPLPAGRRERLVAFAKEWANLHLEAFTPHMEFEPTAGACLENSRHKGGLAGFLHQEMSAAREEIDLTPFTKYVAYPFALGDIALEEHAGLQKGLSPSCQRTPARHRRRW
jgi:Zn-dependent oligopeptidase